MSSIESQSQSRLPSEAQRPSDANVRPTSTQQPSSASGAAPGSNNDLDADGYPPQLHSGAVGYGPEYNQGPGFSEQLQGVKEQIKGKLTHKPDLVEHGRERRTGELKHREQEDMDKSAFEDPSEKEAKAKQQSTDGPRDPDAQRAATVDAGSEGGEPRMKDIDH